MKIDFRKAFAVDIRHDYYADGVSADFQIAPTPGCRQQLLKYGLLFKEVAGGFVVLYETTGAEGPPEAKRKLEAPLSLSFVLRAKAPFLLNYSNLPLDKAADQFFYLSNRRKSLDNGERLLTVAESGFLADRDLISLRPQRFQVDVATAADSLLWELWDVEDKLIDRQRATTTEGMNSYLVDLGGRPGGRYLLRQDGSDYLTFYADNRLVGSFPFAVIEIAAGPSVTDDFSFVEGGGDIRFRSYLCKLQARKTTWEYYVVGKYETEVQPTDLQVQLDDPPVVFTRQEAVALADGSMAIPFVAGSELPLSQIPIKGVTLNKKKGPSTPRLVIDNLPNPSVAEVIPQGAKGISRMYIYI